MACYYRTKAQAAIKAVLAQATEGTTLYGLKEMLAVANPFPGVPGLPLAIYQDECRKALADREAAARAKAQGESHPPLFGEAS